MWGQHLDTLTPGSGPQCHLPHLGLAELGGDVKTQRRMWPVTCRLLGGHPVSPHKHVTSGQGASHCSPKLPRVRVREGSYHANL